MKRFTALVVAVMVVAAAIPAWSASVATLQQLTTSGPRDAYQPDVSPDGKWVVYRRDVEANWQGRLWKIRTDGTGNVQLTADAQTYCDSHPAWSPDGRKIAFQRQVIGDTYASIWTMNPDGTGQKRVVDCTRDDAGDCIGCVNAPAWSPDGLYLSFKDDGESDRYQYTSLKVRKADGSGPIKRVTPAFFGFSPINGDAQWKPAGVGVNNVIAASLQNATYYENASYYRNIALLNKAKPLAAKWLTNGYGYTCQNQVKWNKAGTKIAYKDDLYGNGDIWTMSANGGSKARLTAGYFYGNDAGEIGSEVCFNHPVWSPNGKYVFFFEEERDSAISVTGTQNQDRLFIKVAKANGSAVARIAELPNFSQGISEDSFYALQFNGAGSKLIFNWNLSEWYDSNADGIDDSYRHLGNEIFSLNLNVGDNDGDGLKNWEEMVTWEAP